MPLYRAPDWRYQYRARFIPSAPQLQSYSYTPTGGLTLSGTSPRAKIAARLPAGGLSLSGSTTSTFTLVQILAPSGITFGGTAPYANSGVQHYSYSASGGLTFAGASSEVRRIVRSPAGGLFVSGTSAELRKRIAALSGGIVLGGSAGYSNSNQNSYSYTPTGGLALTGSAPRYAVRTFLASGGIVVSGTPDKSIRRIALVSGGIVLSGTSPYSNTSLQSLAFLADRIVYVGGGSPRVFHQRPTDALLYGFDWSNVIEAGASLVSVAYTLPESLVAEFTVTDSTNKISAIRVSGVAHTGLYRVKARALLSNGEYVNAALVIRGFDG